MNDEDYSNRYQNQSWTTKLWRRRHYFGAVIDAIKIKLYSNESWSHAWSIAKGTAQIKMEWWYTMDEVKEYLEKGRKK